MVAPAADEPEDWVEAGRRVLVCAAVSSMLGAEAANVVRFGDRAACRRLLGRVNTATVERRLAAIARAAEATLVTWTDRPRPGLDSQPYDVVVDGVTRSS